MTGTEIALIITACGTLLTAVTGAVGIFVSLRNSRKLDEVHKTTNSLAERNEAIAKELGVAEGKASVEARPS